MNLINSLALALCLPAAAAAASSHDMDNESKMKGRSRRSNGMQRMAGDTTVGMPKKGGKKGNTKKGSKRGANKQGSSKQGAKKQGSKRGANRDNSNSNPNSTPLTSESVTFTLTSLHPYHHFGFWFTMVHDSSVGPLFTPNEAAHPALERLCETGVPDDLVAAFQGQPGVHSAVGTNGALFGQAWSGTDPTGNGDNDVGSLDMEVDLPAGGGSNNMRVTIVAMIANSNDGCIFLDGVTPDDGEEYTFTEVDIGTEANFETCETVAGCGDLPGGEQSPDNPLCPCGTRGNMGVQPVGEGFMTLHTGIGRRNNGLFKDSDWRAPMVRAVVRATTNEITAEIA